MKKLYLLILLALSSTGTLFAQNCGYDEEQEAWKSTDSIGYYKALNRHRTMINEYRNYSKFSLEENEEEGGFQALGIQGGSSCNNTIFLIPVVFHIAYNTGSYPNSNIADSMVLDQLAILNKAYAGGYGGTHTNIQFCLAKKDQSGNPISGIYHIADNVSPVYDKVGNAQRNYLSTFAYQDPTRFLNIWVVPDIQENGNPTTAGGYSNIGFQNTASKGVVMRYTHMGDHLKYKFCNPLSKGFSLVHEIGHYLGLFHTFQGGCAAGTDSIDCGLFGDMCCDTRPVNQSHLKNYLTH